MMKALQFTGHLLALNEIPTPQVQSGEALIRMTTAGICSTDIEITKGYFGFHGTLGHEFVGVVEECDETLWRGQRVVADINFACGQCEACHQNNPHHCPTRKVLGIVNHDGAFADKLVVPTKNLIALPDSLPDNKAVFAEPLAAALEIQEQIFLYKDDPIMVIGDGRLGLLIAMSLDTFGYAVTLLGRHPERQEHLSAHNIRYVTKAPSSSFKVVVEATGNPEGFKTAIKHTQPRGTLVLKSTYEKDINFNPALIVVNEITVLGSRCGPMQKAVDLLDSGALDPCFLIDDIFSLNDSLKAFEKAKKKGVLKVLLQNSL